MIYAVALLLLALPVYEWLRNAYFFYTQTTEYLILTLYLPARLFALVGLVLMFYQFVLGIRIPAFERVFSRVTNLKRHKTLGKIGFVLILLHGLLLMTFDYVNAGQLLFDVYRILGMSALTLLLIAVIAAWYFKPLKLSRKTWKGIHLLAYVVFPVGFIHGRGLGASFRSGTWTVNALFSALFAIYVLLVVFRLYTYARDGK